MGLKIISQTLAPLLEQEESEVARWIETVCTAGMEMFAAEGRLGITGLGLLRRQHLAPSIAEGVGGQIYLAPPRDTVQFQIRRIGLDDDFLYQAAQRELGLSEEQASRFAYGVEKAIVKLLDTKGVAELGDLGVFTRTGQAKSLLAPAITTNAAGENQENTSATAPDSGVKTTFEPSDALLGFLNSRYLHLEPVTLHDVNASGAASQPKPSAKSPAPVAKSLPVSAPAKSPVTEIAATPAPEPITGSPPTPADYPFPVTEKRTQSSATAATATQSASPTFQPVLPPPIESDPLPSMDITDLESEGDDDERDEQRRRMLITLVVSLTVLAVIALGFLLVHTFSPSVSTTAKPSATATQPAEPKTVYPKVSEPKAVDPKAIEPKLPDSKTAVVTPSETKPAAVEKPAPPVAKPAEKPVEKVAEKPATPVPPKPAVTSATGLPAELTVPVESSKGGSCIVVGSGESRKESEMIAAPYIAKGLAVSFATAEVGGSTRHRVRVGQFASTAAASKAIKEYASLFPKGAFVVRVK